MTGSLLARRTIKASSEEVPKRILDKRNQNNNDKKELEKKMSWDE